ncbi:MAG: cation:dicarboxylase symporter family transporter, partial [Gemmatimonadetes bacterium]|nr:cation:dicarboxylase symporter family transporter [Gemmatimonadota bacterium]
MSLTTRVLLGLGLGLAVGMALATVLPASWQVVATVVEPLGTLWTRALQMTVLPLVVTLLFTGVSSSGGGLGALGARGVLFFAISLAVVAGATLLIAPAILALVPIDPAAADALR